MASGFYESHPTVQRARAEAELAAALQREAQHVADLKAQADGAVRQLQAKVDDAERKLARRDAETTVYISRARIAVGQLERRMGTSMPASWLEQLQEIRAALDALAAPEDKPAGKVVNLGVRVKR